MPNYIRNSKAGATYFFTINLHDRQSNLLITHINELRKAYQKVQQKMPFITDAIVILPDHIHALWTLPDNDTDYPTRIRLFKSYFTRQLLATLKHTNNRSRKRQKETGVWQRRYWEHTILDDMDYNRHMDYIHYNPVKHGHAVSPADWEYSTFHSEVKSGRYDLYWAGGDGAESAFGER
jgi:putative transposase